MYQQLRTRAAPLPSVITLDAMLALIGSQLGLGRRDALALASLVVDLRVTQMVNQVRGVHAVWRRGDGG